VSKIGSCFPYPPLELISSRPVRKFPALCATQKFITIFTKARRYSLFKSQIKIRPAVSDPVPFKAHFNITLQSAHKFSNRSPSVFPTKVLYAFLSVLFMPHAQPILHLIEVVIVGMECQSRSSSLCSFPHTPVNSSPLDPISPSAPYSATPADRVSLPRPRN
jgi:hypothetical protein